MCRSHSLVVGVAGDRHRTVGQDELWRGSSVADPYVTASARTADEVRGPDGYECTSAGKADSCPHVGGGPGRILKKIRAVCRFGGRLFVVTQ